MTPNHPFQSMVAEGSCAVCAGALLQLGDRIRYEDRPHTVVRIYARYDSRAPSESGTFLDLEDETGRCVPAVVPGLDRGYGGPIRGSSAVSAAPGGRSAWGRLT